MSELISCAECGMPCRTDEYHPYAACLLFKAYANSELVRQNIDAIRRPTPEPQGEAVAWLVDGVAFTGRTCCDRTAIPLYTRPQPGEGGGEEWRKNVKKALAMLEPGAPKCCEGGRYEMERAIEELREALSKGGQGG